MHLNAKSNEYTAQCGDLLDRIPKAVFAAIAYSYASSGGDLTPEEAQDNLLREWSYLHDNGIVPQKPPSAPAQHLQPFTVPLNADDATGPNFPEELRPFIDALQTRGIALIPAEHVPAINALLDAGALQPPAELVPETDACPKCGERNDMKLVWRVGPGIGPYVYCTTCTCCYRPGVEL